ncbi:MAG: hypothetical protein ACREDO_07760, partial [Methyloceanibacter sp.]
EYNTYMDVNQDINFAICRAFKNEGIDFAFPTQTLDIPELKEAMSAAAPTAKPPRLRSTGVGS